MVKHLVAPSSSGSASEPSVANPITILPCSCQDFIHQLSVQRALEPHNGHPCSGSNQNYIGKSPGANPIDHANHCFFASNSFMRGLMLSSEARQFVCCALVVCCSHHARIVHACSAVRADHEEVPLHVLSVARYPV